MKTAKKLQRFLWRVIKLGPQFAYFLGLEEQVGQFVLLLTTTGRKSGQPRVTPLVYDQDGETLSVASARGAGADWLRNIRLYPEVEVRQGRKRFQALAEECSDPREIYIYFLRQIDQHPRFFNLMLRLEKVPVPPSRDDLMRLAEKRPMVRLRPVPPKKGSRA